MCCPEAHGLEMCYAVFFSHVEIAGANLENPDLAGFDLVTVASPGTIDAVEMIAY
jgi:hypothetical protein